MSTNALLDIAIGLVLMYLVLSLVCTSINETISTLASMRARTLRTSLVKIIDLDDLRRTFYGHGLIETSNPPSAPSTTAAAAAAAAAGKTPPADAAHKPPAPANHPAYLSGSTFALALIDSLNAEGTDPATDFDQVKKAASGLGESNVRDLLMSNIAVAKDIDTLRTNLATSFDQAMDRVSGEYKRRMKLVSFIVGLLVALAINADSIQVGKALWSDGALRAQMAQGADRILGSATKTICPTATSDVDDVVKKVQCAESALRPLPIGWQLPIAWEFSLTSASVQSFVVKLGGLLITAVALMLGAPFWFDLLSKFMKIRGTGEKPEAGQ